jgi:hypothetical protein
LIKINPSTIGLIEVGSCWWVIKPCAKFHRIFVNRFVIWRKFISVKINKQSPIYDCSNVIL